MDINGNCFDGKFVMNFHCDKTKINATLRIQPKLYDQQISINSKRSNYYVQYDISKFGIILFIEIVDFSKWLWHNYLESTQRIVENE